MNAPSLSSCRLPPARSAAQQHPAAGRGAPDASISQIIEPFGLPPRLVHLVLVNGTYIQRRRG
jgi:hypothetical protein